ncbi:MAG TPA: hypothetical protein DEQ87_14095 [Algoriphagus sp.]|jgi:hypothetical protein|uniref:hypothetical protein n=1 Tax=unclassified Algoriphagus TaxID=2641541 RepID=UPI000C51CC36|nr:MULTISPECIES: hypothetical protein [unclassified Algoriphagus]MAL13558.1 hypothetical protein [Algoriphagus sp.]HAD52838.1 hypothetical protein [Algoriphagus sp.]HAH36321.1 hypothetical protein [Algoriphagus sp.]HAS59776.1 hypothetical protein [Algoriphagus sp.]HAZ26132.1 hypothetical protein [Algoriphagus sp.]|tara:strand:- start:350 stop:1027 length:678 start_codon:yes stop_codon:yes gene_type:complete
MKIISTKAIFSFLILFSFFSCERELEEPMQTVGLDYISLRIGSQWEYEVSQTIYFGENDSEDSNFFYRDRIRTVFVNDAKEQVFIIQRSKSEDRSNWVKEKDYTLLVREGNIVRTIDNQPIVILIESIRDGATWDGNKYRSQNSDEFVAKRVGDTSSEIFQIEQEDSDDQITFRDIRYESYEKGIGMVELYYEVLTYCSRNDCLGEQLIDSGSKIHMKLLNYESE